MVGKRKVLYLDTAPSTGGSVVSLYQLLCRLDRARYEPLVVAYAAHEYVDSFRALGAEVVLWNAYVSADHRPAWAKEGSRLAPMRHLRQTSWGLEIYHGLGYATLLLRRVWPRAKALRRIISERQVGLVHTNIRVGHDREGIVAARMAGIPCVCHVRDFERLNWFDRRLAGMADALIYISEAVQRCHIEGGVPVGKGLVVYNALDVEAFEAQLDAERGRRILGLTAEDMAVGVVGRLESWKGQEVFLRAMASVRRAIPQAKGIVVGDPVPYEPGYKNLLEGLRDELGLAGGVTFRPFQRDVGAVMAALNVLVLPSTSPEPFGRVLIEAMAAGKPVVATDAGAASEIIQDGVHGRLVPAGDDHALAAAIIDLLADRHLAVRMGQAGRVRVRERFDVLQYVSAVQSVYERLLAQGA